jgi:hypothetical protein
MGEKKREMQSRKLQGGRGKQKQKGGAFMGAGNDICPVLRLRGM